MKKILFASSVFAALSFASGAFAADMAMPFKAPPPPPPPPGWTGFYIGGNAGGAWGDDPATTTGEYLGFGGGALEPGGGKVHANGGFTGLQAGYNWQVARTWVLGLETDFQFSKIKGSAQCIVACNTGLPPVGSGYFNFDTTDRLNWFGTVRGRLGFTTGPALVYATGGLAYGEVERSGQIIGEGPGGNGLGGGPFAAFGPFAGAYDNTSTRTGWTAGGGIEGKLPGVFSAWSAKLEYLYVDLGHVSDVLNMNYFSGAPGAYRVIRSDIRENVFRFGMNYQFH